MFKMLTYKITTHFGEIDNFHPQPHTGVDFACPVGTPAQSISDGIVSQISNNSMLGENVRVATSGHREWVYGHLSRVNVTYGQHVSSGDTLGLTGGVPGTTGAGHSTGPHLHLTLLQNGSPIDPTPVLNTPDGGSGWWSILTTPGSQLAGLPSVQDHSFSGMLLGYIGHGIVTLIHIMPEVCCLLAMAFLLVGMVGSRRAMRYAGNSILLSFVGVILNAAIG